MANTIAVAQTHPITPKHAHVGLVLLSVVTTETYTTPAGFSVDFSAILTALGIDFDDVLTITGTSLTGHTVTPIKTATAGTFTLRLWNGATEIANGALTQTLSLMMFYSQGARP
jgi:hypothetical protein